MRRLKNIDDIDYKNYIRIVDDFPKTGMKYFDFSNLIKKGDICKSLVSDVVSKLDDVNFDKVIAIDGKGFIFASMVAYELGKGLALVRDEGKLPSNVISQDFDYLESKKQLEMHIDSIDTNEKVVIINDILTDGNNVKTACDLVEGLGGSVEKIVNLINCEDMYKISSIYDYDIEDIVRY